MERLERSAVDAAEDKHTNADNNNNDDDEEDGKDGRRDEMDVILWISVGFGIAIVLYLIAGVMIWMCVRQRENKNNNSANTNFNTNAITSANAQVSRGADDNGGKGGKSREARIEYRQTEKLPLTTETESVE